MFAHVFSLCKMAARVSMTEKPAGLKGGRKPWFCLSAHLGFDFLFRTLGSSFKFEKMKVAHSPSVAFGDNSLQREPMFARVFSLCRRKIFCLFFGAFKSIPQALRASSLCTREP